MIHHFRYRGLSSDSLTNKWRLILPCSHAAEPLTTIFAQQTISCDHCGRTFHVDYNDQTMREAAE